LLKLSSQYLWASFYGVEKWEKPDYDVVGLFYGIDGIGFDSINTNKTA
jgi:hypothetical protein